MITRTGPTINKGRSKQNYSTPDDFREAVEGRFGPLSFDLAASAENSMVGGGRFLDKEQDSLSRDWTHINGNLWLNPPFENITPWAKKCYETTYSLSRNPYLRILFLVPASVATNWYADWVHDKAYVLSLRPRLTFKGCKDPYIKDMVLAVYGHGLRGFDTWRWKV